MRSAELRFLATGQDVCQFVGLVHAHYHADVGAVAEVQLSTLRRIL
jgi:hypothetical protein